MTPPEKKWTVLLDGAFLPERKLIGGKGWSVAKLRALGLPVPPAFVVTAAACLAFLKNGEYPPGLSEEIDAGMAWLELESGRNFGGAAAPLLVSVRSGAAVSMPGMMDTVLNLGIDETAEAGLAAETGQPDFARNTHRRFYELYASIVLKAVVGELHEHDGPALWREKLRAAGAAMPEAPREQLHAAVRAVFESWNTRRARRYREHQGIPHDLGTAVTVQMMVFGNLDLASGTGVLFSRNPLTGEARPFGEYLPRAQGEDVVSGKFTPLPLEAMRSQVPDAHASLLAAAAVLERENGDVQDIEFTVQHGALFLLQTRAAKRAPAAAVRIAVDMVAEGLIEPGTALARVSAEQVRTLLNPRLAEGAALGAATLITGEGACPGVAAGILVADPDEAERLAAVGQAVILVRKTTSPDDVHGMIAARATVTEQGGATSHAAVVSRALGRPCVVGCGEGAVALAGREVTVDGGSGLVFAGLLPVEAPDERQDPFLRKLISWARENGAVNVWHPDEAPPGLDCLDLNQHASAAEPDRLAAILRGVTAASGAILATPDGAKIALEQGVRSLVTSPVLPVLLTDFHRQKMR